MKQKLIDFIVAREIIIEAIRESHTPLSHFSTHEIDKAARALCHELKGEDQCGSTKTK